MNYRGGKGWSVTEVTRGGEGNSRQKDGFSLNRKPFTADRRQLLLVAEAL
jgi:hypothetical protein